MQTGPAENLPRPERSRSIRAARRISGNLRATEGWPGKDIYENNEDFSLPSHFAARSCCAGYPGRILCRSVFGISVGIAPPPLPVYAQPAIPAPGYMWTPGYWAWGPAGYYWVPGTWVQPPMVGVLWTPGYWGWGGGVYAFHAGYWGPHIGFYGGVNYGFGYGGVGYEGGYWNHGQFAYNRSVNNISNVQRHQRLQQDGGQQCHGQPHQLQRWHGWHSGAANRPGASGGTGKPYPADRRPGATRQPGAEQSSAARIGEWRKTRHRGNLTTGRFQERGSSSPGRRSGQYRSLQSGRGQRRKTACQHEGPGRQQPPANRSGRRTSNAEQPRPTQSPHPPRPPDRKPRSKARAQRQSLNADGPRQRHGQRPEAQGSR